MKLDAVINQHYARLNENDLHILQFIRNNLELCQTSTIHDLSEQCNVSSASILRTAQKLGFSGFSELKFFLKNENKEKDIVKTTDPLSVLTHDIQDTIKIFEQSNNKESVYQLIDQSTNLYAY